LIPKSDELGYKDETLYDADPNQNFCITGEPLRVCRQIAGVLRQLLIRFPLGVPVCLIFFGASVSIIGWRNLYYERFLIASGFLFLGFLIMSSAFLLSLS
jgi:hypothetical protein